MDKKDLIKLFDNVLKPLGFKKKGNYWRLYGDEIIKIMNLQKSQWSNLYYINYGFDFIDLKYTELTMHIFRGIGSTDTNRNYILDFEKSVPADRAKMIENLLVEILKIFSEINSISDLIRDLEQRPHLNDVPLKVKEFLELRK